MTTIPKSIAALGTVIPITYRCNGIRLKRKGFDIVLKDNTIVKLEPKNYPKGSIYARDKWLMVYNGHCRYLHSLRLVVREMKALPTL